jgi:glycosyltransferase
MNKGIRLSTGDVIGILNADDFYADERVLEKVADVFANQSVDACYGDLVYVKEQGSRIKDRGSRCSSQISHLGAQDYHVVRYWKSQSFHPDKFYWGWMPPHPTFFVRRSVYEKYGLFNLNHGSAADYEIMLRFLLKHRIKVAYIPEVLVKMRVGGVSNASLENRLKANQMDRKAWEVNGLKPYPWTLWMKPLRKIPQWWQRPPQN